jgi:hypothetical protein
MDVPTVVRIIGTDERAKKVLVFVGKENDPRKQPNFQPPKGVQGVFDLGVGEFDVEVNAGHSNTRRQEAADAMGQLLPALPPEIAVKFLDLYFLMLDIPMAKQMADRAKKLLPKELQDPEDGQEPIPAEAQMKIAELTQQLQMAMAAAQQMQQQIQTEEIKIRGQAVMKQDELKSRERIEQSKLKLALLEKNIDLKADEALAMLEAQLTRVQEEQLASFDRSLENLKHVHKVNEMVVQDRLTPPPAPGAPATKPKKGKKAA